MLDARKHTGRPTKPAEAGKPVSLGLKVTAGLKSRLDAAARQSGRTQSKEAELRLEQSFHDEDRIDLVRALYYGERLSGLFGLVEYVLHSTCQFTDAFVGGPGSPDAWASDPWAFDQMVKAVNVVLEAVRPDGTATRP